MFPWISEASLIRIQRKREERNKSAISKDERFIYEFKF